MLLEFVQDHTICGRSQYAEELDADELNTRSDPIYRRFDIQKHPI